ncbi:MAG: NAD-dependent epimerase/dehydratase family protein [Thermodesulfobacteriota bacterium]
MTVFSGANVLIAGGTGFVGVNLIKRMLELGANVRATLHRKEPVISDDRIEYIRCDLLNMENCKRVVEGMDYVFMCAANTSGAAVIASTPLVHVTPNIIMNSQILEASYFARVKKFIFLSSNAAYPPLGDRYVKEEEMFNGDPYETYFGVGWMKRYTEILCRMYAEKLRNPMKTVVIRPSNIYGPYDDYDFATSHVMAAMIRRVVERHNPIEVWGTGNDVRDLIYIDDFIDALILATEKLETFEPVNIALGKGYSLKEILQMIIDIDEYKNAKVVYDPSKPSMIPIRLIDNTKAEKLLGFKPKTDIKKGIRKTIEWYRKTFGIARV